MNSEFQAIVELMSMLVLDPHTGLLMALLALAAWSDWSTRRIPNFLVLVAVLMGLSVNALWPATPGAGLVSALAGAGCGLTLMLPLYLLRAMGAGDVKLMAMAGAFLGFPMILHAVLATFMAGGVLALAYGVRKGVVRRMLANMGGVLQGAALSVVAHERPSLAIEQAESVGRLPYGLAIAGGTIGYLVLHQLLLV